MIRRKGRSSRGGPFVVAIQNIFRVANRRLAEKEKLRMGSTFAVQSIRSSKNTGKRLNF